jgi:gas vesicle protein
MSGVLVGGLIGAALGLLLAPRAGEETLSELRAKGIELKEQVEQKAQDARARTENMANEMRSKAESVVNETRTRVQQQGERLGRVAESATRAAQEAWDDGDRD